MEGEYTTLAEARPELCEPLSAPTRDELEADVRKLNTQPPPYKARRVGGEIEVALVTGEVFRGIDLAAIVDKLAISKVHTAQWVKAYQSDITQTKAFKRAIADAEARIGREYQTRLAALRKKSKYHEDQVINLKARIDDLEEKLRKAKETK